MDAPVVVASMQTLARESRLVRLPRRFETVVVDEAHHATADSYRRVLDWVDSSPLLLGVTATPERADNASWGGVGRGRLLALAPRDDPGWLPGRPTWPSRPPRRRLLPRARLPRRLRRRGCAAALTAADAPAHACAAYLEHAPGRKALLFTPTVELAHLMAEAFRKRGVAAEAVDGSLPLEERRAILARPAQRRNEGRGQLRRAHRASTSRRSTA